ncbi:hypothetical protein Acsp06_31660 [Actinomycetospora sp. NBRC 106375]|uniref:helicase-associated domain-containing protein n=1 Tax=Actinomycetospora sp. NBRC 106375 TaxID=3032207 RepID=UPI0024A083A4|nr:helicase-associated domain-containing protein [Actinomycetospora sp. NBRC 106375]GLZ46981.1 hypothetical protein Acsp06_31660 [Actinomycetospora sp. NBRC 106375]
MGTGLADHLAALDEPALVDLLRRRPDVCAEPVPRDLGRLADRLAGRASLVAALRRLDRDTVEVGRALALLDARATVDAVAAWFEADLEVVRRPVDVLMGAGLAWPDGTRLRLPEPLAEHWRAEVAGDEPIARLARHVVADELRRVAVAHDLDVTGLRKAEITGALHDAWADPGLLRGRIAALPPATRGRLVELCRHDALAQHISPEDRHLLDAGFLVLEGRVAHIPLEVAVAVWVGHTQLRGMPELPAPADGGERAAEGAVAAAQQFLDLVTVVLDAAQAAPIPGLKSGGVGTRERSRLVKRLDLGDDHTVALVIDLAADAGLLGRTDDGYTPTAAYAPWREDDASRRWARLASSWFGLDHVPGARRIDGKEIAPPLPVPTTSGDVRRTWLTAAGGRSMRATERELAWFCPAHGDDEAALAATVTATGREAELLGVVVGDAVSPLGHALVAGGDVAARVAEHLVDASCEVVLQSDLTAVVSGRPSAAVSALLTDAAEPESRGSATTYRFSPASVRAALDAGWDADGLLAGLRGLSARALPQPLEYLVGDVARRHGHVRVRPAAACLVLDEPLAEEVLRARALRTLGLTRLAPTVLASASEPGKVMAALRGAGYLPVREDATGAVVVDRAEVRVADADRRPTRESLAPETLAAQLLEAGVGHHLVSSPTAVELGELNPSLDGAELDLLADAVDHEHDVLITYSDRNGTISHRVVTPVQLLHRWLIAWCHLRQDEREFTVANIRDVAPPP